jgi:transcriptional regulator GlxA family with amidase domain
VNSRLDQVADWPALAAEANYEPAEMAARVPVSLRQLERYFLLKFGKTPRRWSRDLQCFRARTLIEQGYSNKATVGTLAFTNEAEFCRIFRQVYGCTPQSFSPVYGPMSSIHKKVA